MAISPPSDIVLDVARAVEPADLQAARAELARRTGGATPSTQGAVFPSLSAQSAAREAKPHTGTPETFRKFEAVVLQTFVQNMLPKGGSAVFGQGVAGDMWKSLLSEKVAGVMAERGGLGIADRLLADRYRDGEVSRPLGALPRAEAHPETDRQTSLSGALLSELQRRAADAMAGGSDKAGDGLSA